MSKDYPCVYWDDRKCKKFSDDNITSWCVWSPCASQTPSNADRIRQMSDEELAELLLDGCRGSKCDDYPQNKWGSVNCFQCRVTWLKQPAEEVDNG